MILLRSILFQILFYAVTVVYGIVLLPLLVAPRRWLWRGVLLWIRSTLLVLRVTTGIRTEITGRAHIPRGPLLVAAKHQSAWETLALLLLFDDPTFILKRELTWIPIFGWYLARAGMIPVDRGARAQALKTMGERAAAELAKGRQILIFPEGTRRPPGAPPQYKFGVAHLYASLGVPCLPIAHNAGLFWPRRRALRPGTIRAEILPAIPPGLPKGVFAARLEREIEAASTRLLAEGRAELGETGGPADLSPFSSPVEKS
ncbi:lysophospholipid acyltransferase family protein [Aquabacter spiritensis]|uniref:1-acyl-sn-glycerol-3-phosphate acyltransferase n=1 Tax=Aquabacter spiritensis TaxID=933073 RepID=A0A4R3M003_9HYPH|nr:lysophospholipid acyltransferase family protein [Aquabacter spiritensis]TCT05906.1 1-acyl-sn-glycerol-3-phosphate acyltransferase [Aquabacter spiritensis]